MTPKQLWANGIVRDCLQEAGGDVAAALEAAQYIVATQPMGSVVLANVHEQSVLPLVQAAHDATHKTLSSARHVQAKQALDAAQRGNWSEALMHHAYAAQNHHDVVYNPLNPIRSEVQGKAHLGARDAHITAARAIIGPEGAKWEDAIKDAYPHNRKQQLHNVYGDWLEDNGFEEYAKWQRLMAKEPHQGIQHRGLVLPKRMLTTAEAEQLEAQQQPQAPTPKPLPPEEPPDLTFKYSKRPGGATLATEDDPHDEHSPEYNHEELHEISWMAYNHGMHAARSGDKTAHAEAAKMHRDAGKHRAKAAERTKGRVKDAHRKMAWAHESSAKMHDNAASENPVLKEDAKMSIDDLVLAIDKPGYHPLHHKVEAALLNPGLDEESRARHKNAHYVLGRMSKTALDAAHQAADKFHFHHSGKAIASHFANQSGEVGNYARQGNLGGVFSQRAVHTAPMFKSGEETQYDETGRMSYSPSTNEELLAHEVFHAVDTAHPSGGAFSETPEWRQAHHGEGSVSKYGEWDAGEGFAEFGRLTHGSNVPLDVIEQDHPLKSAVFKKHGIWPAVGPSGGTHTKELFEKKVPLPGGGHFDMLKKGIAKVGSVIGSAARKVGGLFKKPAAQPLPTTLAPPPLPTTLAPKSARRSAKIVMSADEPTQPGIFARVKSGLRSVGRAAAAGVNKVVTAFKKAPHSATQPDNPFYARGRNIEHHTGKVRDAMAKVGITDLWNTPWHESPRLRQHAILEPDKFDRLTQHLNHHLSQATKFGANAEVVQRKMSELQQLQQAAAQHRADMNLPVAQLLPEHYGKRGASKQHLQSVLEHLEGGGDAKSAVAHLVQHGGLNQPTAKKYVRKAIELAKQKVAPPPYNPAMRPGGPTLGTDAVSTGLGVQP